MNSHLDYLFIPSSTATATATVHPTIGLLPIHNIQIIFTFRTTTQPCNALILLVLQVLCKIYQHYISFIIMLKNLFGVDKSLTKLKLKYYYFNLTIILKFI